MPEIESIQSYQYQTVKELDRKSPVRNYEYDALNSAKKAIPKENALTRACRLESQSKAQESSAKSKMSSNRLSSYLERTVLGSAVKNLQNYGLRVSSERFRNKATQTDYREDECQTVPWEPPYTIKPGHQPEVLTLAHLTWDKGLPAGAHEIELINRMRIRRAWDRVLPPMDTPANIKIRTELLSALEADEWAFRDAEIQFIMNLRMELAQELMESRENEKQQIKDARFARLDEHLNNRKQKQIKSIRTRFSRDLRKLALKHRSAKVRSSKRDVVKLHANRHLTFKTAKASYECPNKLSPSGPMESSSYEVENEGQCRDWLRSSSSKRKQSSAAKPSTKICPRIHGRNERKFTQLCRDLEVIEAEHKEMATGTCSLLKRKPKIPSLPSTPRRSSSSSETFDDDSNDVDEINQSASLLQRLVKGRAIQSEILEGKNRYKELIEELQSARALEKTTEDTSTIRQLEKQQQKHDLESLNESRAREILEAIEGKTIAKMLTFLTDELTRLESEKRAHALALLAERERIQKEIAQASQEQLELNRREELDEMYRQILKINQESVETYLEDIVKEGIEWSSAKEAEDYIVNLADKTDQLAKSWHENEKALDEEGLAYDMLYNLVLPEVEKESARERLRERQRGYLCAAHASIYDATLNLVVSEEESSTGLIDRDVDSIDRVIEMILDYAEIADEENKSEVYGILKDMFSDAEKKL